MYDYTGDVITEGPRGPENKGCFAPLYRDGRLQTTLYFLSRLLAERGCVYCSNLQARRKKIFVGKGLRKQKPLNPKPALAKFTKNFNPESWLEFSQEGKGHRGRTRKTPVWPAVTWQESEEEDEEEEEGDGAWLQSKHWLSLSTARSTESQIYRSTNSQPYAEEIYFFARLSTN